MNLEILWLSIASLVLVDAALLRTNTRDYFYYGNDVGSPLFLTPYIKAGQFEKALNLSKVWPIEGVELVSFTGYITVNKKFNSNLFFWFWPAQEVPEKAPVLLWLQGGPGGSSLFGLFSETGPYSIDSNYKAQRRTITWNKKYSMLYIDQPVGTGYSFTDEAEGYAKNQADVARDLYNCLIQFFTLFSDFAENDFYLTGESYAGKYIPATAYKIHLENVRARLKINLKGVAIGDGFTDPETMIPQYADFIFNVGMFDEIQREEFRSRMYEIVTFIRHAQWMKAYESFNKNIGGDTYPYPTYLYNTTGSSNYFNFLRIKSPLAQMYYEKFVTSAPIRAAIHVGNKPYNSGAIVLKVLRGDMLKSEKPSLTTVMDNYKVLLYNGQLDIIVAATLTEAMLQTVPWEGLSEYKKAAKHIWRLNGTDDNVAGYVRCVQNFCQVIVRNGGHILPADQPGRSYDMITRFIDDVPFFL